MRVILLLLIAVQFPGYLFSQTTLTLLNSYDISGSVNEPSGLAFDKINNQLFTVSDDDNIYRLSVTGNLLETYNYSGDLEGVSMYNMPNTILVAIENSYKLIEFNFVTGNVIGSHTMSYTNMGSSSGIEGVTYNPTTNEIYFLNEKDPGALIVADNSFSVTNEYVLSFAGDYSASYYVVETGLLWLGSDNSSAIYKCNINGTVIETIPLLLGGNNLDKLEGIAIDYANQLLYAVTDGGQELLVYEINDPTDAINKAKIKNNRIIIFPNPANTYVQIESEGYIIENIQIYNTVGENILTSHIQEGVTMQIIDISKLTNGIYFLKIITDKGMLVKSLIKED